MRSVQVRAGQQRYEVLIGRGLLGEAGTLIKPILSGARCAVIADANVAPLFGEKVSQSLNGAGFAVELSWSRAGNRRSQWRKRPSFVND